ncbi:hypothetical protein JTE90_006584 [Oedothorax gibbosus]|uniref:ATPase V1 complex subunit H C-terminal domain-containing protein n=1 Tax=Oedothorax gibbosus TaxID=931172 RepID=A0AAV6VJK7_9ARAC|nr:hypothetical protein JTE90_006584 [Oedothorax gibbosus]
MSGNVDKKEKVSKRDSNSQHRKTDTTDEKTDQEDEKKHTTDKSFEEEQRDPNKNNRENGTNKNEEQEEDGKTKKDQSTTKHKTEGKSGEQQKEKNGRRKIKNRKAKPKKSGPVSFDDEEQQPPVYERSAKKVEEVDGVLQKKLAEIRKKEPINFTKYREWDEITEDEYSFINNLQCANTKEEMDELLENSQETAYHSITKIFNCVPKDEEKKQILLLIYDILAEDIGRAELMNESTPEARQSLQNFMKNTNDDTARHITSQVLSKLYLAHNGREKVEDVEFLLDFLYQKLDENFLYLQSVTRCFQRLLQVDDYRMFLVKMGILRKIVQLLTRNLKTQIQYQLCFCMWVSTFNADIAENMSSTNIIPIVMDLLERCPSEVTKLPRVAIALIRNMLEKPESNKTQRYNAILSIQCQILHYLDLLEPRIKNINDEEFSEDFEAIRNILSATVMEASSYETYMTEVKSGRLHWSVVHTSQNFWVDNAEKFNDNDHELLKMLIKFLENSHDALVLVIASHDLREYMLQYVRGKTMVESLGGKDALLRLLEHRNHDVKYYALKCLQMLMLDKHDLYSEFRSDNRKMKRRRSTDE